MPRVLLVLRRPDHGLENRLGTALERSVADYVRSGHPVLHALHCGDVREFGGGLSGCLLLFFRRWAAFSDVKSSCPPITLTHPLKYAAPARRFASTFSEVKF